MGMTIAEKIMAAHGGGDTLTAGEIIMPAVDMVYSNELNASLAIYGKEDILKAGVFDRARVAIIPDHFTPNKDVASADLCKFVRDFAGQQGIEHYFEVGRLGIEHIILHEKGLVNPGEIVVGADSHSCTYGALGALSIGVGSSDFLFAMMAGKIWLKVPETIRVELTGALSPYVTGKDLILELLGQIGPDGANYRILEFCGEGLQSMTMADRFTVCNMAVEAGAKTAIFPPDGITETYIKPRAQRPYHLYASDPDAAYCQRISIDLSALTPRLACPHSPSNVKPAAEVAKQKLPLDQVFIGSCTNGRIEDLRIAAGILKGRKIAPGLRLVIIPGSRDVYAAALEEGLIQTFIEAEAVVGPPCCGPCIGGHMGILAAGERCVATSNRNFKGRMGSMDSEVYLAGVPVATASAIQGYIAIPEEVLHHA
ncbi:MAG: 3-isopropylmalate dehydratase large subunit [Clostridiales bacterium]|nr:3-isopropylmalate dehydratase large subunit [Clostridiales bacterium]